MYHDTLENTYYGRGEGAPPSPKAVPRPIIGYPSVLCLTVISVLIVVNIITN